MIKTIPDRAETSAVWYVKSSSSRTIKGAYVFNGMRDAGKAELPENEPR